MISTACNSTTDGTVCLAIFISIGIEVTDQSGDPVALDELTVAKSGNGKVIDICETEPTFCEVSDLPGNPEMGEYIIFHDGLRNEISGRSLDIIVSGKKERQNFRGLMRSVITAAMLSF